MERVVTGSLARQRDTAAPVAGEWGVEAAVDLRWDEYDADDILARYSSSPARMHRVDGPAAIVTPRAFQEILESALRDWIRAGETATTRESYSGFSARCSAALSDASAGLSSGGSALICTSGGVLAAVCAALLQASTDTFLSINRVAVNGGITKVVIGRRGATLVSLNSTAISSGSGCRWSPTGSRRDARERGRPSQGGRRRAMPPGIRRMDVHVILDYGTATARPRTSPAWSRS